GVGVDRAARRGVVVSSPDGAAWRTEAEIPGLAWPRVAFGGGTFVVWTEGGAVGASADGAEWSWTAVPRVNTLFAVAWANGRFVASGTHDCCFGEVPSAIAYFTATSPDGRAWETRDAPLRTIFFDLAFAEGVYLASSYEQIFSSVDGTAWTPRRSAAARKDWRYALAFAEGKWVAVGRSAIDVSADGTAWRTLPIP
ncbi:MAG TPA: hypothetical protein VFX98_07330, partial [Longimicrobiaceae bacterium]|nr:hypothetical protein [Longimicrobiaceae bacterium]